MKKLYFVCNFDATGKPGFHYAGTISCSTSDNLIDFLDGWKKNGLKTANLMPSKKAARELCDAWNETYRANGVYAL